MRMKMGYEPRFHNLPGQIPVFRQNVEATAVPILIDTLV